MSLVNKLCTKTVISLLVKLGIVSLGIGVIVGIDSSLVLAAEEVIFYNGMASQSVSLKELENFADTGETSPSLEFLFDFSRQNPQLARYFLNQEFLVEAIWFKNLLNSTPGEWLLGETGKTVHPKSKRANIQALRGSLVQCASDDNKISLLEILQNYPTQQVYVDGTVFSEPFKPFNNLINL